MVLSKCVVYDSKNVKGKKLGELSISLGIRTIFDKIPVFGPILF